MLFIKVSTALESLAPCTQIFSKRHQIHQLEIFGDLGDFRKTSSDGSYSKSLRKFWQKEVKWGQRTCIFPKSTNRYRVNQPQGGRILQSSRVAVLSGNPNQNIDLSQPSLCFRLQTFKIRLCSKDFITNN